MDEKDYKLDRRSIKSMTFEEADDHVSFWNDKRLSERLNAACFIIHQIFGTSPSDKIDLNFTDKRKQPNV